MMRNSLVRLRAAFILAILCRAPAVLAQTAPGAPERRLADTTWQHLTRAPLYAYRNAVENAPMPKASGPSPFVLSLLALLQWFSTPIGQVLLWSLLGILLLYTVYRFVANGGTFSTRSKAAVAASKAPDLDLEPLLDGDWAAHAEAAAAAGDYRFATRFTYRLLLQRLAASGLISYEARSSDARYAGTLQATPYGPPFRPVLRQYERAWFGGYPVGHSDYAAFQRAVQDLLHHLPA